MELIKQNFECKDISIFIDGSKLSPEYFNLKTFKLITEVNTHSKLKISLSIKDSVKKFEALMTKVEQKIEIYLGEVGKEILFFTGETMDISMSYSCKKGIIFNLEALSKTLILDKASNFMVFQDQNILYKEIIDSIALKYPNLKIIYEENDFNVKIKNPIIQYDETDWEFLIRIASHLSLGVSSLENGGVLLGYLKNLNKIKDCDLKRTYFEIGKNNYGEAKYKLKGYQSYALANIVRVKLNEDQVIEAPIIKSKLECIGGEVKGEYELAQKNYKFHYIPNNKIAGKAIEGKVEKVGVKNEIAVMSINLSHGLKKIALTLDKGELRSLKRVALGEYKGRLEFPYTTPYSKSNTGLFCTPEIGDVVSLYFPCNEELLAYVTGTINSIGNGRFSNPDIRNYTLPITGGEPYYDMQLNSGIITQYAKDKIFNKTSNLMEIVSDNILSATSNKQLNISSTEKITVVGKEYSEKFENAMGIVLEEKLETIETYRVNYLESAETNAKNQYHTVTGTYYSKAGDIQKIT